MLILSLGRNIYFQIDIPAAETLPPCFPLDGVTGISDIGWIIEQKEDMTFARVMGILTQGEKGRNESIIVQRYLREQKKPQMFTRSF